MRRLFVDSNSTVVYSGVYKETSACHMNSKRHTPPERKSPKVDDQTTRPKRKRKTFYDNPAGRSISFPVKNLFAAYHQVTNDGLPDKLGVMVGMGGKGEGFQIIEVRIVKAAVDFIKSSNKFYDRVRITITPLWFQIENVRKML